MVAWIDHKGQHGHDLFPYNPPPPPWPAPGVANVYQPPKKVEPVQYSQIKIKVKDTDNLIVFDAHTKGKYLSLNVVGNKVEVFKHDPETNGKKLVGIFNVVEYVIAE